MDITLKRESSDKEIRQTFQQNPGPHLIKICDERAKKFRMKAREKEARNNMRYYGDQVIMKEGKIMHASVKEIIRETDAEEEEDGNVRKSSKKEMIWHTKIRD